MKIFKKLKINSAAVRLLEEQYYEAVAKELERGIRKTGLWTKAFAKTEGNEEKAKALYIEYRIQSIKDEAAISNEILETSKKETDILDEKLEAQRKESEYSATNFEAQRKKSKKDYERATKAALRKSKPTLDSIMLVNLTEILLTLFLFTVAGIIFFSM